MVPKTTSSSSSKAGGGASSASSSSDLYNKMHDYVLSRTPDQSAASQFMHQVMRQAVASISLEIGWHTAHLSALDVLSDLAVRYLLQVAKQSKKYTEHYGRTLVNEDDVALGFKDMNISVSELEEYIQNFDPVAIPKEIPYIPVPRKTDLNILRPGSSEMLTRPNHVHEYMPPMIQEQPEEESETEKEVVAIEVPVVSEEVQIKSEVSDESAMTNGTDSMQNGILPLVVEEPSQVPEVASELVVSEIQPVVITEEVEIKTENPPESEAVIQPEESKSVLHQVSIVQNDLEESSDDDIEPAASKAASIFATFKSTKKLESASENAALKRVRKLLEEQGHPERVVTSVLMTSSGFLSESREGRLPESKPPAVRSFFDPPAPPPKEAKKTTMKKILHGVKKDKGHSESEGENMDGPGLFGVMDKITPAGAGGTGAVNEAVDIGAENGVLADVNKEIPKKKLSKHERKLLQKQKKELKARKKLKMKSKEEKLLLKAKSVQAAAASKELESSTSTPGIKNKLKIFTKMKSSKLDSSGSPIKKKKKDKKNRLKLKELKKPEQPVGEDAMAMKAPPAPTGTELIESDEDFSTADGGVVSPVHIRNPAAILHAAEEQALPLIPKKKIKKEKEVINSSNISVKMKPPVLNLNQHPAMTKKIIKQEKHPLDTTISPPQRPPIPKTKISKLTKRPMLHEGMGEPPLKKKRGRPKKIWGEGSVNIPPGIPSGGGPVPLPAAQLASIGKSLMIKEPSLKLPKNLPAEPPLKMMKIRREHMEIQGLATNVPPTLVTKPPSMSPNKNPIAANAAAALASAELLKRLPAQPGLIPDRISPVPPVRIPKDLPSSISITPAALSSPQKEVAGPSTSRGFSGALPPNVCSSVTITRINMSHQQKLPSPYDDSVTPGIGPPPGLDGPHKRNKLKGVPPPPPLQIPIQAETESGITITPIMMGGGGGGNKEHRYDHPLPPPPPLQERPTPKHSMLAKLDEELSSTPAPNALASSSSSKEQRRKDKDLRKKLKKEKKKKAKDKDKDKSKEKSDKIKKKKDKSGESTSGGDIGDTPPPATVPKLTLKLGGHSSTPTPVDSPNPPQAYHEPPLPAPPPLKKLSLKLTEEPKPPKQPKVVTKIEEEEDIEVARFAPLVTRPQKPARAAKAHAAAAVAAVAMGASVSQEIVQFPSTKDSKMDSRRGRGRPPKGGAIPGVPAPPTPSASKPVKSSLTVLETETVGCIIDEQGNKIWICPACGRQDDGSPMIGCDICDDWYHFACMGIEQEPSEEEQWYCPRCLRKQKPEGKQKKRK